MERGAMNPWWRAGNVGFGRGEGEMFSSSLSQPGGVGRGHQSAGSGGTPVALRRLHYDAELALRSQLTNERSRANSAGCGPVAQLVEQRTENPRVGGSIPPWAIPQTRSPRPSAFIRPMSRAYSCLTPSGAACHVKNNGERRGCTDRTDCTDSYGSVQSVKSVLPAVRTSQRTKRMGCLGRERSRPVRRR